MSKFAGPPSSFEELKHLIHTELQQLEEGRPQEVWAVYTRLSREDTHGHNYSLEIQPDRSEAYAREKGAVKIRIYSDPYRTGRNSRRRELQQLIADIKAQKVKTVVVHRLDRLYRNLESQLEFIRLCKKHHVQFVSVTEQIDPETWWGRLVLYVLGAMAEMYVRQTSERTREAKTERLRRGLPNGNIPLGYCNGLCSTCVDKHGPGYCPKVGEADRLESQRGRIAVIHPVDRYAVEMIVDLYLQNWSFREIASHLNKHKFSLPDGTMHKFFPRSVSKEEGNAREFTSASIRALISTPFLAGLVARYPRPDLDMEDDVENPGRVKRPRPEINARQILEIHTGQHEPLISVETWNRLQQIRKGKGRTPTRNSRPCTEYLLTGLAQCWECYQHDGRVATLRGSTGGENAVRYYRCSTLHNRYSTSPGKLDTSDLARQKDANVQELLEKHEWRSLPAEPMETQLQDLIEHLVIPPEWDEAIMAYFLSEDGLGAFEREGHNLRASLSRYRQLFLGGHIDQSEFDAQAVHIGRQLRDLKPQASPEGRSIRPYIRDFPSLWDKLTTGEKRTLLKVMFQTIYFDSQGTLRKAVAYEPFRGLLGLK